MAKLHIATTKAEANRLFDEGFIWLLATIGATLCYEFGEGVTKSIRWARYYYRKASDFGHPKAKKKLKQLAHSIAQAHFAVHTSGSLRSGFTSCVVP